MQGTSTKTTFWDFICRVPPSCVLPIFSLGPRTTLLGAWPAVRQVLKFFFFLVNFKATSKENSRKT